MQYLNHINDLVFKEGVSTKLRVFSEKIVTNLTFTM